VFFFRPEKNRLNTLERAKRFPEGRFFLSAHFHPIKKSARGGSDRKKNCFFGPRGEKNDGCFSRIYGTPFGEKRLRLEPEDQILFGTERRSVKKHAAVDVFSEKVGSPCGYPVVRGVKKNWGRVVVVVVVVKVWQRQFLLR
jgi:hypothetical protein